MYSVEGDRKRATTADTYSFSFGFASVFFVFAAVLACSTLNHLPTRPGPAPNKRPIRSQRMVGCSVCCDRSCTCDLSHSHVDRERTEDHKDADRTECV